MKIPINIDEAVKFLSGFLCEEDRVAIANMMEDDVIQLHHALGRWIRNNWGLWSGGPLQDHMKSLGFIHADDMSGSIIREYWRRTRGLPSKISEEIEEYKKYWEKNQ